MSNHRFSALGTQLENSDLADFVAECLAWPAHVAQHLAPRSVWPHSSTRDWIASARIQSYVKPRVGHQAAGTKPLEE